MRVGFVTQWFPPEPGTLVAAAIADGLAERGHHVDVLTGFPNYPTGKLQDGYPLQRYRRDDRSPRVTIHRAPLYPSHDKSATKRALNYLSFALAAAWVARRHVPRPDVWLVYSSPATAAFPAFAATRGSRSRPVHLLIEDLWPDSVLQSGMVSGRVGGLVGAGLHALCRRCYRRATGIGVISPSMRGVLVARGVNPARIHYTPNWVPDSHIRPTDESALRLRRQLGLPDGRLFMYAGNMGELQGLEPVVRAFALVPAARLVLVGSGVHRGRLEEIVREEQIANVSFVDPQSSALVALYIAASDVQVVSLRDTALLRATMPSKVQSSLAAGKPVLAHAAGDAAQLVSENQLGLACRPGDRDAAVQAITQLASLPSAELDRLGRRAATYYDEVFSAAAGLDRLERLLGRDRGRERHDDATPLRGPDTPAAPSPHQDSDNSSVEQEASCRTR